jgi:single-strand DNA-binding protein
MNFVALVGRLTKDPIVNYTQGGSSITKTSIAVDRRYKGENGPTADFINLVAFGKTGEFIEKWFHKGDPIAVTGRIQTGSYEKADGTKVYTFDVIVENVEFVPKPKQHTEGTANATPAPEGFMDVAADDPNGMPF